MLKRPRYARRTISPKPEKVETALDRGQTLKHWLDSNEILQDAFAGKMKVAISTLSSYLTGDIDIQNMRQPTAERLLVAMEISDTEAWEMFNISQEKRKSWRSFRPFPMGHGEDMRSVVEKELTSPLQGKIVAPIGYTVQYNPAIRSEGDVVAEIEGGLYVLSAKTVQGRGNILGQFVGVLASKN